MSLDGGTLSITEAQAAVERSCATEQHASLPSTRVDEDVPEQAIPRVPRVDDGMDEALPATIGPPKKGAIDRRVGSQVMPPAKKVSTTDNEIHKAQDTSSEAARGEARTFTEAKLSSKERQFAREEIHSSPRRSSRTSAGKKGRWERGNNIYGDWWA